MPDFRRPPIKTPPPIPKAVTRTAKRVSREATRFAKKIPRAPTVLERGGRLARFGSKVGKVGKIGLRVGRLVSPTGWGITIGSLLLDPTVRAKIGQWIEKQQNSPYSLPRMMEEQKLREQARQTQPQTHTQPQTQAQNQPQTQTQHPTQPQTQSQPQPQTQTTPWQAQPWAPLPFVPPTATPPQTIGWTATQAQPVPDSRRPSESRPVEQGTPAADPAEPSRGNCNGPIQIVTTMTRSQLELRYMVKDPAAAA